MYFACTVTGLLFLLPFPCKFVRQTSGLSTRWVAGIELDSTGHHSDWIGPADLNIWCCVMDETLRSKEPNVLVDVMAVTMRRLSKVCRS